MNKIKTFIKKHETKIWVATIIGGSIISSVLVTKHISTKMKNLEDNMKINFEHDFRNKEEIMGFILNASENDKFAIFKETDKFELIDL